MSNLNCPYCGYGLSVCVANKAGTNETKNVILRLKTQELLSSVTTESPYQKGRSGERIA